MTYYKKKIKFTETKDKTIDYKYLYFNYCGDEFICLGDCVEGNFWGLHAEGVYADKIINMYDKFYTKEVTYESVDDDNVIIKNDILSTISYCDEPNEDEILYGTEKIILLYKKIGENFIYIKNSAYSDKEKKYVIFEFEPDNTALDYI